MSEMMMGKNNKNNQQKEQTKVEAGRQELLKLETALYDSWEEFRKESPLGIHGCMMVPAGKLFEDVYSTETKYLTGISELKAERNALASLLEEIKKQTQKTKDIAHYSSIGQLSLRERYIQITDRIKKITKKEEKIKQAFFTQSREELRQEALADRKIAKLCSREPLFLEIIELSTELKYLKTKQQNLFDAKLELADDLAVGILMDYPHESLQFIQKSISKTEKKNSGCSTSIGG